MLYLTSHGVTATADILEHMAGQMPVFSDRYRQWVSSTLTRRAALEVLSH
ncbi:hypothetical protein [Cedecea sp.]|jgi:hypothetical protein